MTVFVQVNTSHLSTETKKVNRIVDTLLKEEKFRTDGSLSDSQLNA